MNVRRITVTLEQPEMSALKRLAKDECRHPREQIKVIFLSELKRRGLLSEKCQKDILENSE
jgi:hypothetical protein